MRQHDQVHLPAAEELQLLEDPWIGPRPPRHVLRRYRRREARQRLSTAAVLLGLAFAIGAVTLTIRALAGEL